MKSVTIVCDGSSLDNGRRSPRAGAAAILDYQGKRKIVGDYLGAATNQQAEIVAACLGLEALRQPCRVRLISDSQYVIKTMTGLFRRKANLDLWRRLDEAAKMHKVSWSWTRGHAGHNIQEKCDRAARLIASQGSVDQLELDAILAES
jgi:ribonuclease HI